MTAFNPNLFDELAIEGYFVLIILTFAIWFIITVATDAIYMWIVMSFRRRHRKRKYKFPKYLEDDEE